MNDGARQANHDRDVASLMHHIERIERLLEQILAAVRTATKEASND
jgi:hypothetical protein